MKINIDKFKTDLCYVIWCKMLIIEHTIESSKYNISKHLIAYQMLAFSFLSKTHFHENLLMS